MIRKLNIKKGEKILDLACGHGRHSIKLKERGYDVIGVDINEKFLEVAREQAEEKSLDIEFRREDMRDLEYEEEFDIVLLIFTSFGYFYDKDNFEVLKKIYRALKPGGLFCLDIPNRDAVMRNWREHEVTEREDGLMVDRNSFDVDTGRILTERIILKGDERSDQEYWIRIYSFTEIREKLKDAGFEIHSAFGNWKGENLSTENSRMITIAKKPR